MSTVPLSSHGQAFLAKFYRWSDNEQHQYVLLLLPFAAALISAGVLILQSLLRDVFRKRRQDIQEYEAPNGQQTRPGTPSRLIAYNGGIVGCLFVVARVLGCAVLVGLSVPPLLEHLSKERSFGALYEEWAAEALLLANIYALLLASLTIMYPKWRKSFICHNIAILLVELAVYLYRDVWPLANLERAPADVAEGWLLWAKIAALAFTGVLVPLFTPRVYSPVDPKNPATNVNPEQTASILAFFTYVHLNPIIAAANKTTHLPPDQFPQIADYDTAQALSKGAYPYLDPLKVRKGRHIFFGVLRLFAFDYFSAVVSMTIFTLAQFLTPIAINQLLSTLENGKKQTAIIRPWFWILCLLLAPLGSSVAFQSYVFTMTRTLVRTESILTQLLFDYSLRVRVKAESSEVKPENAGGVGHESRDATLVNPSSSRASETGDTQASKRSQAKSKADAPPTPSNPKGGASSFVGKLNNLATVDLNNIVRARDLELLFYQVPIQLIGCSIFLYVLLGWSALVGLTLMVALLLVSGYMTKLMQGVQKQKMKASDTRTQTVTESMSVLRMIKMFGWERKIQDKIDQKRDEELKWIWKGKLLEVGMSIITGWIPTVTMLATYAVAALVMKMELKSSKIFASMILFDSIKNQLYRVNYMISTMVKVSIDRFNAFFKETELLDSFEASETFASDEISVNSEVTITENDSAIMFRNASFTWTPEENDGVSTPSSQFKLTVPDELHFSKGKLNMIVGPTGSGKTSLLMALLGEMHFIPAHPDSRFNLPRAGGVSFAVQESWVQNETIRDNIIFKSPYDEERYKKVLHQCALEQDLELFEAGDLTEVGERGLTLSGGQKARLTLARAIYSGAEIILLDDVLAALDVHTSKWVVNKCFRGDLVQGRTILLVTHNIALVGPIADFIVSVSLEGVVSGSVQDLSDTSPFESPLYTDSYQDEAVTDEGLEPELANKTPEKDKQKSGQLIVAEEVQQGKVGWKTTKVFLEAIGGRRYYLFFGIWISGSTFKYFMQSFILWFMGYWSSQYEDHPVEDVPVLKYLGIYVLLALVKTAVDVGKDIQWMVGTMRASRTIHKMLSDSILRATLRWLDETPISRIITRITQDINSVDGSLMMSVEGFGSLLMLTIVDLYAAVFFVPVFTIPGLFIALIGMYIGNRYLQAQLSVKREMSNAKAPVLAHFGAAMAGLVSVRAYGAQSAFQTEFRKRIDHYVRIARLNYDLNRWVGIRIDALGAIFTASLAAYLTYFSHIGAANIGFSLNRAVEFCTVILYMVRVFNGFQVEANSMERIVAYTEIEHEPELTETGKPPAAWPTSGEVRVENLNARYSKTGPAVLQGLSFELRRGERVGVVGRTGSGKSSLTLALLRCILTDGTVYFDGLPTDQINLDALRSSITIIPQLPELLSGTLRYNLDPFDEHDDATLNAALRSSGLPLAASDESGDSEGRLSLDSNIASGGANVSVGQRQIIALARAIVRSSKLLILDEASSAIDYETDSIIQNTLRRELASDVTLLTIAHRLQTIIDADRIMVLDAGRIVEFAPPAELLAKDKGLFKALVDESENKAQLYEVAMKVGSTSRT